MGFFTDQVVKVFSSVRGAWDDVVESFSDHFIKDPRRFRIPDGVFENGIVIVTPNEVNDRHGTGVILSRAFKDTDNILSIRTSNLHGEHGFGKESIRFFHRGLSRPESYSRLGQGLRNNSFRYVICVPYHADDLLTAIVIKDVFAARLCVYVMDDNYLIHRRIPGELINEALEKSSLRLAISPEMRDAYEQHFGLKFWIRPPLVTSDLIRKNFIQPCEEDPRGKRGVVVGSLWSNQILERLADTVHGAGLNVDWYGNSDASWLAFSQNELMRKGINCCGHIAEAELAQRLCQYAFALVPSGSLDAEDQRIEISKYSLPTRMPFLLAVGNIPTIVLGHPMTAAASFVARFNFGEVVDYEAEQLKMAVNRIGEPERQFEIRKRAATLANYFGSNGVGRWILDSMEKGQPVSNEMEMLFHSK